MKFIPQLSSTLCSFTIFLNIIDLDPQLPISFSRTFWLITLHEWLIHPQITFRILLGIKSFKVSPEFDSLTHIDNDFPNHYAGKFLYKALRLNT